MVTGYTVADVMTPNPITVSSSKSIKECAEIMTNNRIGCLIIVDKNKKIKGIVTDEDFVRKAVRNALKPDTPISRIMIRDVITIKPEDDIEKAMRIMSKNDIRHLPVVKNNKLVGIITVRDILRVEPAIFELVSERIRIRGEEFKPVEKEFIPGYCDKCGEYSDFLLVIDGELLCPKCRSERI
ncbi:CBS domain-containing protein [Candidatus Woesearchaeota archaeon]|nr:CBS domain-containing protein [Candidatus Woesearchaeota archaeon]